MNAIAKFSLGVLFASILLLAACSDWPHDLTVNGIALHNARTVNGGITIGQISQDTVISGRPCKHGWVHLTPSGVPVGFFAAKDIVLDKFTIPADTWVMQSGDGVVTVCAFPHDVTIQGHLCAGGWGGSEGVQAAFYPSGSLKEFYLREDIKIGDIPCATGGLSPVMLYENGKLKSCTLGEDVVIDGKKYDKGTKIRLDGDGKVMP